MRQRRAKLYRKMLHQYSLQFGFREPYQLLLDDTFSLALSRYKISDPLHQFSNILLTKKVKPLITQCCMQALYTLGKEHQSTVDMAKAWERRMCNHREAIDPQECIKQCVGDNNKHRYIVASEQGELRRDLRLKVAGLPMMHFTQAVMVLEPMSPLTRSKIEENEENKLSLPASETGLLKNAPKIDVNIIGASSDAADVQGETGEKGNEGDIAKQGGETLSTRRRKRKAPNPLSVRKSKNPRLTMEEKLKREQELKKQKQRAAARARMEASKISNPSSSNTTTTTTNNTENRAAGETRRRKRKRGKNKANSGNVDGEKMAQAQPKVAGEAKTEKAIGATEGGATKKKRRRRRSATPSAATATVTAPAAAPPTAAAGASSA